MTTTVTPYTASVLEISHRGVDCLVSTDTWNYLAVAELARIGFTTYDGIQIVPVRYAVDGHSLVFTSPADGVLAQLADLTCRVACEVDHHDDDSAAIWHVLMHGMITRRPVGTSPDGSVALRFVPATMAGRRF